jgi:hypothetical protein
MSSKNFKCFFLTWKNRVKCCKKLNFHRILRKKENSNRPCHTCATLSINIIYERDKYDPLVWIRFFDIYLNIIYYYYLPLPVCFVSSHRPECCIPIVCVTILSLMIEGSNPYCTAPRITDMPGDGATITFSLCPNFSSMQPLSLELSANPPTKKRYFTCISAGLVRRVEMCVAISDVSSSNCWHKKLEKSSIWPRPISSCILWRKLYSVIASWRDSSTTSLGLMGLRQTLPTGSLGEKLIFAT